ncbi:DNA-formamidopyrimidine glycosylase family protein [Pedobacter sp. P351]|uniref:DNA-formamidopyrimidine glycosylase family protein n=1 Tax=Pedobacter superstes TaxID=3133441 RepID=UPI00309FAD93
MPEAPTILVLCENSKQFIGQKVLGVEGSIKADIKEKIKGNNILNVRTYGKQLLILFPEFTISVHLMLFGSFTINSEKPGKLTLGLTFKTGNLNFYASVVKLIEKPLDEVLDWRSEVMNENFDQKLALKKVKANPNDEIVDVLIDQNIFTGVGNKIRNEVLFRVMVHPLSKIKAIPDKKLKDIIEDCVKFSFEMLEWKRNGVMDDNLVIYKRKECPRDKMPIIHEKLGSRTVHFCEKCQELFE